MNGYPHIAELRQFVLNLDIEEANNRCMFLEKKLHRINNLVKKGSERLNNIFTTEGQLDIYEKIFSEIKQIIKEPNKLH